MSRPKKLLSLEDHIALLDQFDTVEQNFKDTIHERIQAHVEIDPATDCMVYTGCWEPSGQAKIRVGVHIYCLSRVTAWLYVPGFKVWSLKRVVRTCDTPACCNPEHIRVLADQAAAMDHQRETGRIGVVGRQLTRKKAEDLRRRASAGETIPELVADTGMRRRSVRAILLGRTWAPKREENCGR